MTKLSDSDYKHEIEEEFQPSSMSLLLTSSKVGALPQFAQSISYISHSTFLNEIKLQKIVR
jgi:hypothetical protein